MAIALAAIWPFIGRASLPLGTDAELHVFRLAELSHLVRSGELYPRWAPDFYHGFGYPIFNYYAPLSYYAALPVELLPGLNAVAGVKAVFVLGTLLGGLGVYGFVRDNWGRWGGLAAASLFLYAPYIQYIDPQARGVLAESFSFGVMAMALWFLDKVRRGHGRFTWSAAVGWVTAVILSHNLMALLFFGMLSAWAVWLVVAEKPGRTTALRLFSALGLGLGLAAFFWLPVILERNAVNLNTLIGDGGNYDFRTHFLTWRELLSVSRRLDWGAAEPAFSFNLGVAQWAFGGAALALLAAGRVGRRPHLLFFALSLAVLLFLMLPASAWVWQAVPFLPFFQFPWRLLGATAILLAILSGAGFEAVVGEGRRGAWAAAAAVILPILLGLPLTQPAPWDDFGPANLWQMSQIEQKGYWLGTTSTADYVPVTVEMTPGRQPSVVAPLETWGALDRVNWATVPPEAVVTTENITPLHVRYTVDSPLDFRLRLFLLDFPGWQVKVNGRMIETELGTPEGFIVIPLTAGQHVVDVDFRDTPARQLAWGVTAVSLLAALLLARRWWGKGSVSLSYEPIKTDGPIWAAVLGVTALFVFGLNPSGVLHLSSTGNEAVAAETAVFADFGRQIALIGYTANGTVLQPGDDLSLAFYWKAQAKIDINYSVFVHILRPDGSLIPPQSDKLNPGDFPTRRWTLDKYVTDEYLLSLPPDFPPGRYTVAVGFWVLTEGWRLPLLDENGMQIGDRYELFDLVVEP